MDKNMPSSGEEVSRIAATLGYAVSEAELDDYVTLLGKAKAASEAVDSMDGTYFLLSLTNNKK